MAKYLTSPPPTKKVPKGIPYIIGNELAERFSFYGMKAILVVFMVQHLMGKGGSLDLMTDAEAKGWYHLFISAVYFTPLLGALLSDGFLGKYKTIIILSIVYCLGHLALALDHTRVGLAIGLGLIALGSGGIKPCVSAHVGDQFGSANQHLLSKIFGWFYFSINVGSFLSILATPLTLKHFGPGVAFGIPGILMFLATIVFWMGRNTFVHIPPGGRAFVRETFSPRGIKALGQLIIIYLFVAVFWALYDQSGSSWILQAQEMNRNLFGYEVLPSQIQAINPLLILMMIPLFSYVIYPAIEKVMVLTELRKIAIGLFGTAVSFGIITYIQLLIDQGGNPHIVWQFLAYLLLTAAEVMVSITCLEFSYRQAPKTMKSFIMALYMMSLSLGNLFTSAVNFLIQNDDGSSKITGVQYYLFFTGLMLVTALLFLIIIRFYKGKAYIHGEDD